MQNNEKTLAEATRKELMDELVSRCQSIVMAAVWNDPDELSEEEIFRKRICVGNGLECLGLVRLLDDYAIEIYYRGSKEYDD